MGLAATLQELARRTGLGLRQVVDVGEEVRVALDVDLREVNLVRDEEDRLVRVAVDRRRLEPVPDRRVDRDPDRDERDHQDDEEEPADRADRHDEGVVPAHYWRTTMTLNTVPLPGLVWQPIVNEVLTETAET